MIVSYGIRTYGKQNAESRHDACEHCGAFGKLRSYDAAKCFHIFWIPLIPLGKKRVMDLCPKCKRYAEMPLGKYRKLRDESVKSTIAAMQSNPDDADAAIAAIQTFISFSDLSKFEAAAPALAEKHAAHAGVQRQIGAAYGYLGNSDEAIRFYGRALAIEDDPETREDVAAELIRRGQPAEAEAQLAHVAEGAAPERLGILYFLARGYAHVGSATEAVRVLDQIETLDPEIAADKDHKKMRAPIDKAAAKGASVPAPALSAPGGVQPEKSGLPLWLPQLVPVAIILAIVGGYLVSAVTAGQARRAWLVNGISEEYAVVINGKRHVARPGSATVIRIAEGTVSVKIDGTPLPVAAESHEFRTSFLSRPFDSSVVVINPDRQAVLVKEYTVYAQNPVEVDIPPEPHCGSGFYVFNDIDYPFEIFPEQVSIGSASSKVTKSRLFRYSAGPGQDELSVVFHFLDPTDHAAVLERRIRMDPRDDIALHAYFSLGIGTDPESVLKTLREGRALRPLLVDWHRLYQEGMATAHPEQDLRGEYEALLGADPESGVLKYLLGRITDDPAAAEKLYLESERDGQAGGRGFGATAYHAVCSAQYNKGLEFAKKALEASPERVSYRDLFIRSSLAAGELETLLAWARDLKADHPRDGDTLQLEAKILALLGRSAEAATIRDGLAQDLVAEGAGQSAIDAWVAHLSAPVLYVDGKIPAYLAALRAAEDDNADLRAAFCTNDAAAVVGLLADSSDPSMLLLAYCQARGKADEAQALWTRARKLLDAGNADSKVAARMMEPGGEALARSELATLNMLSDQKRVLAVALGLAYPDSREQCFKVARAHNYDPVFPHHLVAAWAAPATSRP